MSIVDSRVGGNVSANGALEVTMCKTTVGGSVSLIGTTGDVLVGDGGKCPTNTIGGGLEIALAALRDYLAKARSPRTKRAERSGAYTVDALVAAARADRVYPFMRPYLEALS